MKYKVVLRNGNKYEKASKEVLNEIMGNLYEGYKCKDGKEFDIVEVYEEVPSLIYKEGLNEDELKELRVKDLGLKLGEIEKKIMNLEMERNEIVYEIWKRLPKLVLDEELQPRSEKEIKLRWK